MVAHPDRSIPTASLEEEKEGNSLGGVDKRVFQVVKVFLETSSLQSLLYFYSGTAVDTEKKKKKKSSLNWLCKRRRSIKF